MFARTDRLLLRPGWMEDAPALAAAIGEEAIVRNLATVPWPYGLRDAEAWLSRPSASALPHLLIFERGSGTPRLVGCTGFGRDEFSAIEFGYWIASDRWNRGYATEAGRAALALARDSLRVPCIVSGHFVDNPASGRVLEKLGFVASGEAGVRRSLARGEDVAFRPYRMSVCGTSCGCDEPERMAA